MKAREANIESGNGESYQHLRRKKTASSSKRSHVKKMCNWRGGLKSA